MDMVVTGHLVITHQAQVTLAVDNLGQITRGIMHTDISHMLHGVAEVMALDKIIEVLEVEKVLS